MQTISMLVSTTTLILVELVLALIQVEWGGLIHTYLIKVPADKSNLYASHMGSKLRQSFYDLLQRLAH